MAEHEDEQRPPPEQPDDRLAETQEGKGYGEDEGERDPSLSDE